MIKTVSALLLLLGTLVGMPLNAAEMTDSQRAEFERLLPGLELTDALVEKLEAIAYNQDLSLEERVERMKAVTGVDGFSKDNMLERRICIWDLGGRSGPIYNAAMDQRARALEFGVDLEMIPYTNEGVMVEAFKAGQCDAALMSGLRARTFNSYTGTIDAVGAIPDLAHMKVLLQVLAHPSSRHKMVQGEYVIMGAATGGGAYVFVNDRRINSLAKAAGKKVAVLDYDEEQAAMVANIGATPVRTSIVNAPGMFNNGVVDVLAAPLMAFEVMELYKGLQPDGGIINYPLAMISMQLVGRVDKFPNIASQFVREEFYNRFDEIQDMLEKETAKIPEKWFVEIPAEDKAEYETMMQEARISLRDRGYYDPDMLTLQRKIRCKFDDSRAECTQNRE
jgi:hypothetical protein